MSTKPIFIGITGGTGAGKSTLCEVLLDKYPDRFGLIQLDDYFKPPAEAPKLEGFTNYDHPDSLYLNKLAKDLLEFSRGHSVVINTKNERLNPEYTKTQKKIAVEIQLKPMMLVEGYLVLWDERVRKFLRTSIWLDVDHDTRWSRRVHFKYPEYEEKVLKPMYKQFAEPTKRYADHFINVTNLSKAQVLKEVEKVLFKFLN